MMDLYIFKVANLAFYHFILKPVLFIWSTKNFLVHGFVNIAGSMSS